MKYDVNKIPVPGWLPKARIWNRLEGRPRVHNIPPENNELGGASTEEEDVAEEKDFSKSLKAEVYDPLWMLTRQWQFGEFQSDDGGTALEAEISIVYDPVNKFMQGEGDKFEAFNNKVLPIEAKVEAESAPFDLKMNLQITVYLRKCLQKEGLADQYFDAFVAAFPLEISSNSGSPESLLVQADPSLSRLYRLLEGRLIDGHRLVDSLNVYQNRLHRLIDTQVGNEVKALFKKAGQAFKSWFDHVIYQNKSNSNWISDRLEYQFSQGVTKADKTIELSAQEFYHGHLDWYNFSYNEIGNVTTEEDSDKFRSGPTPILSPRPVLNPAPGTVLNPGPVLSPVPISSVETKKLIPVPIRFTGMPAARWWAFEDGRLNFGKQEVGLNDLATLQLMEFGLIYSNDWHIAPFTLPTGITCSIKSFNVKDVFGITTNIQPFEAIDTAKDYQKWSAFSLTRSSSDEVETSEVKSNVLFLPPVILDQQESKPIESIRFKRDEWNNVLWAIEDIVPGIWGDGIDGHENYQRLRQAWEESKTDSPLETSSDFTYTLVSDIPENWFPFIPQRQLNSEQIKFILAQVQKAFSQSEEDLILPLGLILSEQETPYILREEEIPYSGLQVTRTFQRTRWTNGKVITWIGRKKKNSLKNERIVISTDEISSNFS